MGDSDVFLSDVNSSKKVARIWKMMKEVVVQDVTEPMRMLMHGVYVSELWL
jgi:hypothetical protein